MSEDMSSRIFELKGKGFSQRDIAKELGIRRSLVRKTLKNPSDTAHNDSNPSPETPDTPLEQPQNPPAQPPSQPTQPPIQLPGQPSGQPTHPTSLPSLPSERPASQESEPALLESFEKEMWVMATPIIRKVALNPKIVFWYDWFRGKYNYDGDIGDFLVGCVEDFFENRGYTIKIVKEEPMR